MTPRRVANLDPRVTIGRNYRGAYLTLLHTKYKSSWPHGFREDFLYVFSYYKSMEANDPRGVANSDPRGMIGRIYEGYHLTLLPTKYIGFRPCGFREEYFFIFFPL